MDKKSRLKQLRKLSLKNTEVSDVSLRYITQYLPQVNLYDLVPTSFMKTMFSKLYITCIFFYQLSYLAVSGCWKLTDGGMAMLVSICFSSACSPIRYIDIEYRLSIYRHF